MPIQSKSWGFLLGLLLALVLSGCVMRRTVKEGDVVVEKGYVLKGPMPDSFTGF